MKELLITVEDGGEIAARAGAFIKDGFVVISAHDTHGDGTTLYLTVEETRRLVANLAHVADEVEWDHD